MAVEYVEPPVSWNDCPVFAFRVRVPDVIFLIQYVRDKSAESAGIVRLTPVMIEHPASEVQFVVPTPLQLGVPVQPEPYVPLQFPV